MVTGRLRERVYVGDHCHVCVKDGTQVQGTSTTTPCPGNTEQEVSLDVNTQYLSQPQTIMSYDGFVCQDDVMVFAATSNYRLGCSDLPNI